VFEDNCIYDPVESILVEWDPSIELGIPTTVLINVTKELAQENLTHVAI